MKNSNDLWWTVPDGVNPTDPFATDGDDTVVPISLMTQDLYAYADCYKTAADVALQEAMQNRGTKNLLSHPVVFLYRHYIELALKDILILGRRVFSEQGQVNPFKCHRIDLLWKECQKYITRAWPSPDDTGYMAMAEATINRFAEPDPESFNFRYPVNSAGEAIFLPNIWVGLQNLKSSMDHLEGVLFGVASHFEEGLSLQQTEL